MVSIKSRLIQGQWRWASEAGLEPDARGYLPRYELNLFKPLNERSRLAFENGSGSELRDTPGHRAKMRAAHSSSALAVNVFDAWVDRDTRPLVRALGLEPVLVNVRFEAQFPTGLPGNPPNLDVALERADRFVIGVESKFTEWLTPKSASRPPFKAKYFPPGTGVWDRVGLTATQRLAESIQCKEITFRYLDAPQLVKHALGLATHLGRRFRLLYIYFDCPGSETAAHHSEINRFSERVRDEIGFQALSYQELFSRLEESAEIPPNYLDYLRCRYFGGLHA
jgi:hypothetical protein